MSMRAISRLVVLGALVAAAGACKGAPLNLNDPKQPNEVVVGQVEGKSTGIMLFQFIPIGQNQRFNVAYERALAQAPGATRLADVTVQENWFWAWILNGYMTTVSGTAVK